jgi:hypothetical protein
MLRVTVAPGPGGTVVTLEGRLAGPWVDELARCWDGLPARDGAATGVRLDGVTFIDAAGKALLRRMHREGARFAASGCETRAILDEIVR